MKQKLVLAWVDHDGYELTGRYRDRLGYQPETRAVAKAHAAVWGDDTPSLRARLVEHLDKEARNHEWAGFFLLDNNDGVLRVAREKALHAASAASSR